MKKLLTVVVSALVFGVLAGGTMVGINVAAHKAIPSLSQEAQVPETQSSAAQSDSASSDTASSTKAQPATTTADLDVSGTVEEAMPQVVSITNTMLIKNQGYSSLFDYFYGGGQQQEYEGQASGSGVILKKTDSELLIVTNNHVVQDSKELSVTFVDGTTVDAAIKGTDSTIDLAVVAVQVKDIPEATQSKIKVATLHDKDDLKVGQGVIAIGNALGFGQSVTVGYISALNREIQTQDGATNSGLIQVDAAINPGNSGGALLNMKGEVIGINVAKLADTEVEGIGYAIPIYKAVSVIDNLSNAKTKVAVPADQQGRLGVYMNTVTAQQSQLLSIPQGVIITGFSDETMQGYEGQEQPSPAKEAGLQKNDVITKFDGQGVETAEDLQKLVTYYEAGSKVQVTYKRLENGQWNEKTAEVTLGTKSAAQNSQNGQNGQSDQNGQSGQSQGSPDLGVPNNGLNNQGGNGQNGQQGGNSSDGSGQNGESQNGSGSQGQNGQGNMYDLFRQFLEQQGSGQQGQ